MKLNALVLAFFLVLMTIGSSCALQPSSLNDNRDSGMSGVAPENANIRRPTKHDAMDTIRGEVPAEVKNAFSKAATVAVQHKELTLDQVKSIERESGATIVDSDFSQFYCSRPMAKTNWGGHHFRNKATGDAVADSFYSAYED